MALFLLLLLLVLSCERRETTLPADFWLRDPQRAFEESKARGKPVFLYFSARWCSWCRVYEEVLSDEGISSVLRGRFVPLLLDSDRDRDLFLRFGGRGTPFTVILDYRGKALFRFHGAIEERDLMEIMGAVLEGGVTVSPEGETVLLTEISPETYRDLLGRFLSDLEMRYDPEFGGFSAPSFTGGSFKWSTPLTYTFLLERGLLREEVLTSLRKDVEFLYDDVDGGFFNFYDRTRAYDFHFETSKSLSVNALMLSALLTAHRATGDPLFLKTALGTYRYMREVLHHRESSCFLNAQISDPAYYDLPPERRRRTPPPPADTAIVVEYNAKAIRALVHLHRVTGEREPLRIAERCLDFIDRHLRSRKGVFRYYDVESGGRGVLNFERDLAFLSLALLEMGRGEEAEELLGSAEGWEDWVSRSVASFVLTHTGRERALSLLKGTEIDLSYRNPDDLVFLLMALERLVGMD